MECPTKEYDCCYCNLDGTCKIGHTLPSCEENKDNKKKDELERR